MFIEDGKTYLITSKERFFGPDGELYKGAYGTCRWEHSGNYFGDHGGCDWYVTIGDTDNKIKLSGNLIISVVECKYKPENEDCISKGCTNKITGLTQIQEEIYYFD